VAEWASLRGGASKHRRGRLCRLHARDWDWWRGSDGAGWRPPTHAIAGYVTMGLRQTMGEQGYPTGVAGVAEERARCSAERSCCRPQARWCLSHFTVGEEGDVAGAMAPLSHVRCEGSDGDHGGRTGRGPDAGWVSDACGERVGWRMVAHDVPPFCEVPE
jgi:hypothetical protein